jgi:hypothetical protein
MMRNPSSLSGTLGNLLRAIYAPESSVGEGAMCNNKPKKECVVETASYVYAASIIFQSCHAMYSNSETAISHESIYDEQQ